jgi:ATP-dependent protease HslVU (ClpYQ) peptidase subunit
MTVIVAVKDKQTNQIYMAGDRMASNDSAKVKLAEPKVFFAGGFLIGYAGTMSGNKIQHNFEPTFVQDIRGDINHFMQSAFLKDLKAFYDEWGIDTSNEAELSLLIAVRGNIYEHHASDMSMILLEDGIGSIGTGSEYALGSLYATPGLPASDRAKIAVDAATYFSPFCGYGIDIENTSEYN